jgi:hypothetical protein
MEIADCTLLLIQKAEPYLQSTLMLLTNTSFQLLGFVAQPSWL